jgi:KDO2-lipid IV(A) lauroyltransferase
MRITDLSSAYYRFLSFSVMVFRNPVALERFAFAISRLRGIVSSGRNSLFTGHLKRLFPEKSDAWIKEILDGYWRVHERNLFALFYLMRKEPGDILKRVSWEGRDILDRALQRGKGVLLLVPHFGDERSLHVLLGMAGYPVHVITSRYTDMPAYAGMCRLAVGNRWNTLHFPDENPRWMYSVLQNNGILHYGSTAYGGPGGTWITNFGVRVLVPSAPWKIRRRTGCAVLFARCAHTPGMGFSLNFAEPDLPEDKTGFALKAGDEAEKMARELPAQYEWKNLAIRHRETGTIIRTGIIPSDERELEMMAIPEDSDPGIIHQAEACSEP